ncbi:MAG: hypothetical protein ACYC25_05160 [Paludibacter sp.]
MRKRLDNKSKMYNAVRTLLDQNADVWEPVPAVAETVRNYSSLLEEIDSYSAITQRNKKGITVQKASLQGQVIRHTYQVSSALYVLAIRTKNPVLAGKVHYTESDLLKKRDAHLVSICTGIAALATEQLAGLTAYGVTEDELATLKEEIAQFSDSLPGPRLSVVDRKAANEKLKGLFRQVDDLLRKQLDRLMVRFRQSHPEFYASYQNVRRIVNYGIRHVKPLEPETPAPEVNN